MGAAPPRRRARPQRYQLGKQALAVLASGHPWIFRGLTSSATAALADGQWLALVDGANRVVGHGVYAAAGAIAIRVLARGPERPTGATFAARIERAIAARERLRAETDGVRWLHGESDGVPAVTVDGYGPVIVAHAYAAGVDGLARFAAVRVARAIGATGVVVAAGHRRIAAGAEAGGGAGAGAGAGQKAARAARVIAGAVPDEAPFREGPLALVARPLSGQKTGTFLDLRGLRRHLAASPLAGARVLNLFAYTGTLGLACEHAGAASIVSVDRAADALALAARHHVRDPDRHRFVTADVFDWLPRAPAGEAYDLVIVDPPSMTSRMEQVPQALAAYRRLHRAAAARVAPGGTLVLACCTSRLERRRFREAALAAVGDRFALAHELPPEADHPVGFPEADYLKILVLRERAARPSA
ncbi:MAG TPA: class I SAM-dependent methyltransferase [Kofleriaceae bacterium]|nr:class I SAM-dependent methyltransferase [Kofleriaceae bacterium]